MALDPAETRDVDSALVGRILALLAHDLRNPLSALSTNLDFLAGLLKTQSGEVFEVLDDAVVSCDSLAHITENIDVLARYLAGEREAACVRLSMAPVVADAISRCSRLAQSHGCRIVPLADVDASPIHVHSNRTFLTRAIDNLICNGIQYGCGTDILIGLSHDAEYCRVTVTDSGYPLADSLRERTFSLSGQLDTKGVQGGRYSRGLGLFVASAAATAAGATLVAEASEKGARFVLTILVDE